MISGIGGTGVVTIGALLGMAAHLEGLACSVFDMTGLSQKNGAVYSHVRIAPKTSDLGAQKLGAGEADLVLAFDAVAALSREPVITLDAERSRTVVNARITPTPAFQRNPDLTLDHGLLVSRLGQLSRELNGVDASGLGLALLGDSIAANLFMLGYACQLGLLPVSPESIERAVEINAVAVPFNKSAFALGRLQAIDPDRIASALQNTLPDVVFEPLTRLDDIVAHRTALLTAYQNASWAERYRRLVDVVADAEAKVVPGSGKLAVSVARNFAKLMAYKDEYEVARLQSDPAFKKLVAETFEDGARLRYNLAPPLFARRDPQTGHLLKREFGSWIGSAFGLLAKMKGLRGTAFDPFGRTAERKMERALIDEYEARLTMVAGALTTANHAAAVALASLPQQIRGYGHVKEEHVTKVRALEPALLERFRSAGSAAPARDKIQDLQSA
jgi:indolepyruvate ferredoxin oxidoreductase